MTGNRDNLVRLQDLGFTIVGHWKAIENGIDCELSQDADSPNALYVFAVDGDLMYVGKTTQTLRKRLAGYRKPSLTQATNIKNHKNIKDALAAKKRVEIYIFRDMGLLHFGGFHLNLAAGLEDSLVVELDPPWNGGRKDEPDEAATVPQIPMADVESTSSDMPVGASSEPKQPELDGAYLKPSTADFAEALTAMLADAAQSGVLYLDVRAGDLRQKVGGYDGPNHRMVPCCNVMRKMRLAGDKVLREPPKGNGANLTIRYFFPRPRD